MSRPVAVVTGPTSGLGAGYARRYAADRLSTGVRVLVNNAGVGTSGEFWTADPALLQSRQDVNVTAVIDAGTGLIPRGWSRTPTNTFGRGRGRT